MTRFFSLALLGILMIASQQAIADPVENQFYRIQCIGSKLYLGVGVAKADGGEVLQRVSTKELGQQWEFVKNGEHYNIINRKSGKALSVPGGSKDEGVGIIQSDVKENNSEHQQWQLIKKGDHYIIKARHSGLVLDVSGGSKDKKVPLIQWPLAGEGADNQIFKLVPVTK